MELNQHAFIENWVSEFKKKHGRFPRVLHIGNIANNAYINGKIMRRYKIEADVISLNYYHIMGCPEWEDAEFEGDVGDDCLPNWWAVKLNGFKRPNWFLQGETSLVLHYLLAKNSKKRLLAKALQKKLHFKLWQLCAVPHKSLFFRRMVNTGERLVNRLLTPPKPHLVLKPIIKRLLKITRFSWTLLKKLYYIKKRLILRLFRFPHKILSQKTKRRLKAIYVAVRGNPKILTALPTINATEASHLINNMINFVEQHLPQQEQLSSEKIFQMDTVSFQVYNPLWKKVCDYYDIVQGYATEGIYPLLAGCEKLTAYEHGTLREIPFQENVQGRLCAHTYKNAKAVFVTNIDCLAAAERLQIDQEKIIPLPHAFDSNKAFVFLNKHREKTAVWANPPTFIAPARHHWVTGDTSWRKGNDMIICAAKLLQEQGLHFKVQFINWGKEVAESKQLIADLKLENYFEWVEPMRKNQLWLAYLAAVAVLDQFVIPAMGGVGFETLALGRRLLTRLDITAAERFFGEAPPIYNADSPENLAIAMTDVIADPYDKQGFGLRALQWSKDFHSSETILKKQLQAYSSIINAA